MKIVQVITRSEIGGAQVVVLELVRHMPEEFSTIVVAGELGFLQEQCDQVGVPFHLVPRLIRNINPLSDVIALVKMISLIRREEADLVHCHTSKAGAIARLACWITGTPSVYTAHTWSFDEGISRLQRLVSVPIEKVAALIGGPIITVSNSNRRKALNNRIAPPGKILTIWLGIPDLPLRSDHGARSQVRMIMTARFVDQKDHSTLLRALTRVSGDWRFVLVGDGPLLHPMQQLAHELGLRDSVSFLGNRSDVPELLADSDIFILSTKWEGLPVSILEAMRAGLPVIATDVGGVSELVLDGTSGYLTRVADERHLAHRIQQLVDSRGLRRQLGMAARNRYTEEFQMDKCISRHIALYRSCVPASRKLPELTTEAAG